MSVLLPSKPIRVGTGGSSSVGIPSEVVDGNSGIFVNDTGDNASISLKINGNTALYLDKFKRLGINTETFLTYRLEINDPDGDCIKMLREGSPNAYIKNIDGNVTLSPEDVLSNGSNIMGKLFLNNVEVVSGASKLNYTNVFEAGTAERNKCLVLDSDRSVYNVNTLSLDNLIINKSLTMDMDSDRFALNIKNRTGKCLKLYNDEHFAELSVLDSGILTFYNSSGCVDISCGNDYTESSGNMQYPLQLTGGNNSGVGIKFNTYNNSNIKRNMSSIETIIINNENNMENSIIKFNNMKDGQLFNTVTIRNDGFIVCNTLLELSDMRKKRIISISDEKKSLDVVNKIKTYDFVYTSDEKEILHKGVMAQELHRIVPSAVNIDTSKDEYTVSNKDLIGYLIDSIKSLTKTVDELQKKVNFMEQEGVGYGDYAPIFM